MATRAQLKTRAKNALRNYYWTGFLVCVITLLLGGSSGGANPLSVSRGVQAGGSSPGGGELSGFHMSPSVAVAILGILLAVIATMWLLGILWCSFVGNVIRVGSCRYFVESQEQRRSAGLGQLFSGFSRGGYLNVVKVMFMKGLFETLWTFLLIIPGIIKAYEYYLVPYLLAETPDLPYRDALRISRDMMDGHKMDLFVLELSFWGWRILGSLLCGFGILFVRPYEEATYAEFYLDLCGTPSVEGWGSGADGVNGSV